MICINECIPKGSSHKQIKKFTEQPKQGVTIQVAVAHPFH